MKNMTLFLLLLSTVNSSSHAQVAWQTDGVPVCTATNAQQNPVIVPDQKGGGIVIWQDYRAGNYDIYAQRVDSAGNRLWASNGVVLAASSEEENNPSAISDMRGGAIMVFNRGANNVWAQRVDSTGNACWGANGMDVSSLTNSFQMGYKICSDSAGGAYITWANYDTFSTTYWNIYSQLLDSTGNLLFGINGVVIAGDTGVQATPEIVSSHNSALIIWRGGQLDNYKLFAQRINNAGNLLWPATAPVCTSSNVERYIQDVTIDNNKGGIIVWKDRRNGNWDIYTQRVDSSGNVLWQLNGVPVCTAVYGQEEPVIASDGKGGGIITWHDYRDGYADIYSQRVDSGGTTMWQPNGVAVCSGDSTQAWPCITATDTGMAVISWFDFRYGQLYGDVYAQALMGDGSLGWASAGLPVCTATEEQFNDIYNRQNQIISADEHGNVIIVWHDYRNGNYDIYAQRIQGLTGVEGEPPQSLQYKVENLKVYPNPFKSYVNVTNVPDKALLKIYDITGRLVVQTKNKNIGGSLKTGIYFITANGYKPIKAVKIK